MVSFLYIALTVAGVIVILTRIPIFVANRRDVAAVAVLCSQTLYAVGIFFAIPSVLDATSTSLGVSNAGQLITYTCAVFIGSAVAAQFAYWQHPNQAWKHYRKFFYGYIAAFLTMVLFFALGNSPHIHFKVEYARNVNVLGFLTVYQIAFSTFAIRTAYLALRGARMAAASAASRIGLQAIGFGCVIAIFYPAGMVCYELAYIAGGHPNPAGERILSASLITAATLPMMAGLTLPAVAPLLAALGRRIGRMLAYRDLGPLWYALYQATPTIALDPPATLRFTKGFAFRDTDNRLYRRVVEIRDGQLALRAFAHPEAGVVARQLAQDAGLADSALEAVVEATRITAALRRKAVREGSGVPAENHPTVEADMREAVEADNLEDELRWVRAVSGAFTSSSIVREAVERCELDGQAATSSR